VWTRRTAWRLSEGSVNPIAQGTTLFAIFRWLRELFRHGDGILTCRPELSGSVARRPVLRRTPLSPTSETPCTALSARITRANTSTRMRYKQEAFYSTVIPGHSQAGYRVLQGFLFSLRWLLRTGFVRITTN
jgi:hypothetical protein